MTAQRQRLAEYVMRDELPFRIEVLAAMSGWSLDSKAQWFDTFARHKALDLQIQDHLDTLFDEFEITEFHLTLRDQDYVPTLGEALHDLIESCVREYMWHLTTDPDKSDPDDPFASMCEEVLQDNG